MMNTGAQLLLHTIRGIAEDTLTEEPQGLSSHLKHAPKIYTDTCSINWNSPVWNVYNLIRGLSPFPGAFTKLHGKIFKIYSSEKEITPVNEAPGEYSVENGRLKFSCTNGYIYPKIIQAEGRKKMPVEDFVRGLR
jgi:methionyl-tRNA formyltransferase